MTSLYLFLLFPIFAFGGVSVAPSEIEVGESVVVRFSDEELTLEQVTGQVQAPFEVVKVEESDEVMLVTLTSWTAGLFPLSFRLDDGRFSPVFAVEISAPPASSTTDITGYIHSLVALEDEEESLLSEENRRMLEQQTAGELASPPDLLTWIKALALILGVAYGFYFLFQRFRGRTAGGECSLGAAEEARVALDALKRRGLPEQGAFDPFYVELTFILRRYVERQYGIRAPELSTEEFLIELGRKNPFDEGTRHILEEFLLSADRVKFAGHTPALGDCDSAYTSAERFIR